MSSSVAEGQPEKTNTPDLNIPQWVIKAFGNTAMAGLAIADEQGNLPQPGTNVEKLLRPESSRVFLFGPERFSINAAEGVARSARSAREKALFSSDPLTIGNHRPAVAATVQALSALNTKNFNTRHGNRNPQHAKTEEERQDLQKTIAALDWSAYRPSGYKSYRVRRGIDKFLVRLGQRTPEQQVEAERLTALRTIGQIANFEARLREIITADETGETDRISRSHQPALLRKHLGELALKGKIDESSPFHTRWSEQQDPVNIQALRRYMVSTSNNDLTGEDPRGMADHIEASGINGSVRPQIVCRYLGITKEEWDAQRFGQHYDGPGKVPAEVLDQINFLIKLDSQVVDFAENSDGTRRSISALDVFIKYEAGKPWSEVPHNSKHKGPIGRIIDAEENIVQAERKDMAELKAAPLLNQLKQIELRLYDLPEDSPAATRLLRHRSALQSELSKLGVRSHDKKRGDTKQGLRNTEDTINIKVDELLLITESLIKASQQLNPKLVNDPNVLGLFHIIDKLQTTLGTKEGSVAIDAILPVLDDFDLALKSISKMPKSRRGLKSMFDIITQLQDVLKANGVERLEVVGKKFDPKYHEAIEAGGDGEKQLVSEEVRAGYKHGNSIIRPALVKVKLQ